MTIENKAAENTEAKPVEAVSTPAETATEAPGGVGAVGGTTTPPEQKRGRGRPPKAAMAIASSEAEPEKKKGRFSLGFSDSTEKQGAKKEKKKDIKVELDLAMMGGPLLTAIDTLVKAYRPAYGLDEEEKSGLEEKLNEVLEQLAPRIGISVSPLVAASINLGFLCTIVYGAKAVQEAVKKGKSPIVYDQQTGAVYKGAV